MTFGKFVGGSSAADDSSIKEEEFDPHSLVGESSLAVGKNASLTLGPDSLTVLGTFSRIHLNDILSYFIGSTYKKKAI